MLEEVYGPVGLNVRCSLRQAPKPYGIFTDKGPQCDPRHGSLMFRKNDIGLYCQFTTTFLWRIDIFAGVFGGLRPLTGGASVPKTMQKLP